MRRLAYAAALVFVLPLAAEAQLVVQRADTGLVATPALSAAGADRGTTRLAGSYAGRPIAGVVLVGGAAYWVVDGPDGARVAYSGAAAGCDTPAARSIRFGARGLAGAGRAEAGTEVSFARFGGRDRHAGPPPLRVRGADHIFVLEPRLVLLTNITDRIAISSGTGSRTIGTAHLLHRRLDGWSGSVALQLAAW